MKIKFWGVRGSIPVPGPDTARFGGNTACVEVTGGEGECIILDAGSGIRVLGLDLMKRGPFPLIHILISHTHWDHIQGFPFFGPCYIPGTPIRVKGPVYYNESGVTRNVFDIQMQYEFFPVSNQNLDAAVTYDSLGEGSFEIDGIEVKTQTVNHPVRCLSYRLIEKGRSVVYTTDHEPYLFFHNAEWFKKYVNTGENILSSADTTAVRDANRRFIDFIRGADLFIVDSQYTPDEYLSAKWGWGHSPWDHCLEWMKAAEVDRMALTHHDPLRTDRQLEKIHKDVLKTAQKMGLDPKKIMMAREGMEEEI